MIPAKFQFSDESCKHIVDTFVSALIIHQRLYGYRKKLYVFAQVI